MHRGVAALLLGASLVSGCSSQTSPQQVRLNISPQSALLERPIAVSVTGLHPGQRATITASAVAADGRTWRSSATFVATDLGVADTGEAPVAGSYSGVDPMGIFDRMQPVGSPTSVHVFISPAGGYSVSLSVTSGGATVAHADVRRVDPWGNVTHVRRYRLGADGIYADLFTPPHSRTTRRPAVLLFDGSLGGLQESFTADLLAAEGYPTMALAYFGAPGLPSTLDRIPLEYFVRALRVLRRAPGVDPRHLIAWGVSRGSEAALLLGVRFPHLVHGVVAAVPSSVVNPGYPDDVQPAWTLHNKEIPFSVYSGDPTPPTGRGVIPVERIRGPVLLICGGEDAIWPSCRYSDAIVRRLAAHGRAGEVTELKYPTAGHLVGEVFPYVSALPEPAEFGGTTRGDFLGRNDAWRHVLAWLHAMH